MNEDILNAAIAANVAAALAEDLGDGERRRDLTAQLIPANAMAHARVITRQDAVLAGQDWFAACFRVLDPNVRLLWQAADGEPIRAGQMLCEIRGNARALLSAERPALNFLQTLSGVATATRDYVSAVAGTRAKIYDTRKTLPGLRLALKYAVKCGGGENQRIGLYDGILIKENHIAAAGGIRAALEQAFALAARPAAPLSPDPSPPHPRPFPPGGKGDSTRLSPLGREVGSEGWGGEIPVQIEVENLEQLREALDAGATLILLDNFDTDGLRAAVRLAAGRARLEASGGITLDNVRAIAETGVDRISIGALTKNLRALDLSMRLVG